MLTAVGSETDAVVGQGIVELPFEWYQGLGAGYRQLFWGLLALAAVMLVAWLVNLVWTRVLMPLSLRTKTQLDVLLLKHSRRPVLALVVMGGLKATLQIVSEGASWATAFTGKFLDGLLYTAVVLAACGLLYAVLSALCDWYVMEVASKTKTGLDDKIVPILRRLAKVAVLFLGLTVVLGHFDVKIAALLGAAGIASLAVALAAQETVANMICGFTILVDRPFQIGDRIQLADGITGDVYEIGLRSTKIMTFDHTLLILPNKEISNARIINLSYPDPRFAIRRDYSVAYGSDVAKVKGLLTGIASAHPKVLKDPAPAAFFTTFGDSALVVKLICYVGDYRDAFKTTDDVNMEVKERFAKEGIEIPFPQCDVHIRNGNA